MKYMPKPIITIPDTEIIGKSYLGTLDPYALGYLQ